MPRNAFSLGSKTCSGWYPPAAEAPRPAAGEFALVPPLRPSRLDGFLFYFTLPFSVARHLRAFRADAVIVESPYEGFAGLIGPRLARSTAPLILEVHGDWRTAMRLYGG